MLLKLMTKSFRMSINYTSLVEIESDKRKNKGD